MSTTRKTRPKKCEHGRHTFQCTECGVDYCEHGRLFSCRYCGRGYCEHKRPRLRCHDCGTGGCPHGNFKQNCIECGCSTACKGHPVTKCFKHGSKFFDGYCIRCLVYLKPDHPEAQYYRRKEWYIADCLREKLKSIHDEYQVLYDKKIGGCSQKRPDVFIDLLTHVVIVEVDENQHESDHYLSCETAREMILFNDIAERPVVFIRFNPDDYIDSKGNVHDGCFKFSRGICVVDPQSDFTSRIDFLVDRINYNVKNIPSRLINREFLYYDGC